MLPITSVIILAFNKAEYTARCLAALTQTVWRPLEVILVDNGSTDGIPDLFASFEKRASEFGLSVRVIRNETNLGASTGRNQGLWPRGFTTIRYDPYGLRFVGWWSARELHYRKQ